MINFKVILNVLGVLLLALSALMLFPLMADIIKNNSTWMSFLISLGITLSAGITLILSTRDEINKKLIMQDAFLLTTLSWIFVCLFGSLPFYLSDLEFSLTDSIFESMSGVTTTGSTIIQDVENMSHGILIWRALLQWIGGVGIIVMAISILPVLQVGGMQVFRTESSDTTEKILPKTTQIASAVIIIYFVLTLVCLISYWIFGMNFFDALVHSMTTIATGGFSSKNESFASFNINSLEYISCLFMILSSLPILIYLEVWKGNTKKIFNDTQIITFIYLILFSSAIVIFYLWLNNIKDLEESIRLGLFNVISIITGTGYTTDNFNLWGPFPIYLLFFGMFIGGCAGSTTCGIKIFRFQILFETLKNQLQKLLHPHGVFVPHYNHKKIENEVITSVMGFFFVFILSFIVITLLLSTTELDFVTSLSAAATSLANVGPGLGNTIGPESNFGDISIAAKWILIFSMLLGRLELLTVLVIFLPAFWKN
jgi:trk system potassium uptake protein TrkH